MEWLRGRKGGGRAQASALREGVQPNARSLPPEAHLCDAQWTELLLLRHFAMTDKEDPNGVNRASGREGTKVENAAPDYRAGAKPCKRKCV